MTQVHIEPWLLHVSLWVMAGAAMLLLLTIAVLRVARRRRSRLRSEELTSLRRDILQVASDDDQDGSARRRLEAIPPRQFRMVAATLVGLLSKVHGRPAAALAGILTAHGAVTEALIGVGSRSRTDRASSAWTLGLMRRDRSVHRVIPLLQDRDRTVAITAARSLGMLGDPRAARPLLAAVSPGPRGRGALPSWVVTEALVALGPEAAQEIGDAVDHEDPTTRAVAALALGLGQHVSQSARVRDLVEHESSPDVLAAAAETLGRLGSRQDLEALVRLTAEHHPRSVRSAAVRSLGEIGGGPARHTLLGLLADQDPRIGDLAAEQLCHQGPAGRESLHEVGTAGAAPDSAHGHRVAASARFGLVMDSLRRGRPLETV